MSLRINSWKTSFRYAFWLVFGLLLLIFLIRVMIFENNYYNEKEGSERDVSNIIESPAVEELIEIQPSEEEVREYTVAPDRPRYLSIDKLGVVNARVLPMSLNANKELGTPNNIFDVGWYDASGKPGTGGTMIIDGHNGGPHVHGVFKKLPDLVEGDLIVIERGDGILYRYRVVENKAVLLADANAYMSVAARTPEPNKESVTLISCTGEWSEQQGTYLSRQFTRAVLVEE